MLQQGSNPDLGQQARNRRVVDPCVGEEVLVLGGQDCTANDEGDLLIFGDPPALPGQVTGRLVVGIIDVADGRKVKAGERLYVGTVRSVETDVMESDRDEKGAKQRGANYRESRRNEYRADDQAEALIAGFRRSDAAPATLKPKPSGG